MAGFKETISNAIGNSEIFNKTTDFLAEKQKKFKATQALKDATIELNALYLELGKTSYRRKPLTPGRTSTIIRAEIDAAERKVEVCQAILDNLNAPYDEVDGDENVACESEDDTSSDNTSLDDTEE